MDAANGQESQQSLPGIVPIRLLYSDYIHPIRVYTYVYTDKIHTHIMHESINADKI